MTNLRVLLADADSSFRTNAERALSRQGYFVIPVESSTAALEHLEKDGADVVVADVALPPRDGLELLRTAKAKEPSPPVILLTDPRTIAAAATGVRQGAFDYLIKPLDDFTRLAVLIDRVAGRTPAEEAAPPQPEPEPANPPPLPTLGDQSTGRLLTAVNDGQDLPSILTLFADELAQQANSRQALILLAKGNGQFDVAASHGFADQADAARTFNSAGWEDFAWHVAEAGESQWQADTAAGPTDGRVKAPELLGLPIQHVRRLLGVALVPGAAPRDSIATSRLDALRQLSDIAALAIHVNGLEELAAKRNPVDSATGLWNKDHFFEEADREFRRSWRFGEPLGALELDIDDFSRLLQLLGSESSDAVMEQVAQVVRPRVRGIDLVGRLDRDKIGVVLLMGTRERSLLVAERLRRAVAEIELVTPEGFWQVTASVGVATYPREQCASVHDLFALAAQGTRAAKRAGRNRVVAV